MIGSQLGNYRVISRLGEGGMGTVYRATDIMLDRDVALKVLRPELARQAALVERFRAEAVALARLRHEHIAALYGLDRQGDELVMVMEFVSGETLESRLTRLGPMQWQETIPIMRGVLAALGHAHVRGVVHRDIKPANVMVDADGTVKVMDFGIARLIGENRQTKAGVAIGTPTYMAPEQLRGEDVDGRTDLYAAGALLFELLTGRVAFEADSDYSLMMQQLNEPPPAPSTVVPGVPRSLDAAVSRAMAKKPAQRFASATDFSRALDEVVPETSPVAPVRDVAAAVVSRAPRDWRVYVIAACVLVATGLGAAALRSRPDSDDGSGVSAADSARTADPGGTSVVASQSFETPAVSAPSTRPVRTSITAGLTEVVNDPSPAPVSPSAASPTPARSAAPVRSPTGQARPPAPVRTTRSPSRVTENATPTRGAENATPVAPAPAPVETEPVRNASSGGSAGAARRVQELAERCVASIASNSGGTASRLLRGDAGGIMAAINDGRIVSASGGSVAVDVGDGRGEGSFPVRIAWRTAFGGNKSGTARLTAEVSRSDGGWSALGCRVESSGGVR